MKDFEAMAGWEVANPWKGAENSVDIALGPVNQWKEAFQNSLYWSSEAADTNDAWGVLPDGGVEKASYAKYSKNTTASVRCVQKM